MSHNIDLCFITLTFPLVLPTPSISDNCIIVVIDSVKTIQPSRGGTYKPRPLNSLIAYVTERNNCLPYGVPYTFLGD